MEKLYVISAMVIKAVYAFLACLSFSSVFAVTDKVICYYETWNEATFGPQDIDINICTHINYAFVGINEDGTLRLDGSDSLLRRLADLKTQNPNLKLIISVGGYDEGSTKFSDVAADAGKKATLAESALSYLQTYNFDGVDIDWEYPGLRGGIPEDRQNFVDLLSVLRDTLKANGDYLVTTAVCSYSECASYDMAGIASVVDYINLMTYDFHSADGGKTGENSPLYASSTDSEWERNNANCDAAVNIWINGGAPAEKIILGMAFYGRGFTLVDPNNHGVGAPSSGGADGGSYDTICALTDGWTEEWDSEQQVPYKWSGTHWIGYDNPRSIGLKVQYAKSRNLGGVMMWAVDQDDKDGSCGSQHALLQAVKDNL